MDNGHAIISLGIGVLIGARVGLKSITLFFFVIAVMYLMAKVPLSLYKSGAKGFYGIIDPSIADAVVLIVWILFILLISIKFGERFFRNFGLQTLDPVTDRALGAAGGGATAFILSEYLIT